MITVGSLTSALFEFFFSIYMTAAYCRSLLKRSFGTKNDGHYGRIKQHVGVRWRGRWIRRQVHLETSTIMVSPGLFGTRSLPVNKTWTDYERIIASGETDSETVNRQLGP
ncbi:hypothetical protein L218DRAFT_299965 [Marasmius fiardii PR-910]|nr:hypothetical protein L218DRAFT_299965 [Marasmius fiardii PR-910]